MRRGETMAASAEALRRYCKQHRGCVLGGVEVRGDGGGMRLAGMASLLVDVLFFFFFFFDSGAWLGDIGSPIRGLLTLVAS